MFFQSTMSALSLPNSSALTLSFVISDTHFTNDLGADSLDRVELMLAIEDQFAGVEITDADIEHVQVVGDLIRHPNIKPRQQPSRPREQL
jgi:acyl carrier protein